MIQFQTPPEPSEPSDIVRLDEALADVRDTVTQIEQRLAALEMLAPILDRRTAAMVNRTENCCCV